MSKRAAVTTAPNHVASKPLAQAIWEHLEAQPGFREGIAQAEKELAEGKGTLYREVRRHR